MNWNAIKTIILGSGVLTVVMPYVVNFILSFFGCTGDNPATPDVELTNCVGNTLFTIPLWAQAFVAGIVLAALTAIKAFTGTGSVTQNLFYKQAPVVKNAIEAKPGVVTEAQVAAPGAGPSGATIQPK